MDLLDFTGPDPDPDTDAWRRGVTELQKSQLRKSCTQTSVSLQSGTYKLLCKLQAIAMVDGFARYLVDGVIVVVFFLNFSYL